MTLRGGPLRSSSSAVSVPGWRPEDFHRLLTNFFEEGVVQGVGGDLAVTQRGAGANMSVDVAAGLALIEFTTTLLSPNETIKSWLYSDDVVNVPVPAADLTNPRKDRIVAMFDVSVDPNTAASNIVSIELVQGTAEAVPTLPALPSNAIHLKTVNVAASATSITNGNLADTPDYVKLKTDVLKDVVRFVDLASTDTGLGASLVGVEDDDGNFTADNVEDVLAEIQGSIDTIESDIATLQANGVYGDGSDGALNVASGTTTLDAAGANILRKQYSSIYIAAGATLTISNPAADGTILMLFCQGNCTIDGTINMSSMGATAATGATVTRTSNGLSSSAGNRGTEPFNRFQQVRTGTPGNGDAKQVTQPQVAASGAGGPASTTTSGGASSVATNGTAVGAAANGGASITTALLALAAQLGIIIGPGPGGSSGGVAVGIETYASGTFTATSGAGGRGGGGLYILCGGDFTLSATGTINLSGGAASASSASAGSAGTGSGSAAGGSSGGAAGTGAACVRGAITNAGTITVAAGSNGALAFTGICVATAAGTPAAGAFSVIRSIFPR